MGALDDLIFIYGGTSYGPSSLWSFYNDLWKFNTTSNTWVQLFSGGAGPGLRGFAGDLVFHRDNFYLFGGMSSWNPLTSYNDLWRFHYQIMALTDININPNPVTYGRPFNLSWAVCSKYGSSNHSANILFEGRNYTAQFPNVPGGWIRLNITNASAANFSLVLVVTDPTYSFVTLNETIDFTRI
jgi:hypothetical protein